LRRRAPRLDAQQLAAALVGTARPAGPPTAAGSGRADEAAAARAPALAEPRAVALERPTRNGAARAAGGRWTATVTLVNPGRERVRLRLEATLDKPGLRVRPSPRSATLRPGGSQRVTLRAGGRAGGAFAAGRLTAKAQDGRFIAVPLLVPLTLARAPHVGHLTTVTQAGEVTGVRFALGSVRRGRAGIEIEPVESLRLVLVDAEGREARELTPPGGAPDLLPGDYSYTLPDDTDLRPGDYRFRAIAHGVQGSITTVDSEPFRIG
jgi:hypothetical protein